MSRGLGKVQRRILETLVGGIKRSDVIAQEVYQTDNPTNAQVVAIRRAIHTLAKSGLVGCGEFSSSTDKIDEFDHVIYGPYLFAWLPHNQPSLDPVSKMDSSEVKRLIIERLAEWGDAQAYQLGRGVRRQLKDAYGFSPYGYVPQYNRALHQLEKEGAIRRFQDDIYGRMITLTTKQISVAV